MTESILQISKTATFKRKKIRDNLELLRLNELQRIVYYAGDRKSQIVLSQMRLQFSDLRCHLYDKQCIISPLCSCGEANETISHYFNVCTTFTAARSRFHRSLFVTFGLNQICPL
jgi:hypothetical protein